MWKNSLKVGLLPSKNFVFFTSMKALYKWQKILFISSFYFKFSFYLDFFGHVGKRLDKKTKVTFKIRDIKTWETNNHSTNIVQNY